jgi:hypothetical protein
LRLFFFPFLWRPIFQVCCDRFFSSSSVFIQFFFPRNVVGSCGRFFFLFSCGQGLTCIFSYFGFERWILHWNRWGKRKQKKVSNWKVKRRRSEKHGLNVFFWRQILYCEIDEEKQKSQTKM